MLVSVTVLVTMVVTMAMTMIMSVMMVVRRYAVRGVRVPRSGRGGSFHSMAVLLCSRDRAEPRVKHGDAVTMMVSASALGGARTEIAVVVGCIELVHAVAARLLVGGECGKAG